MDGFWTEEPKAIEDTFSINFQKFFSSSAPKKDSLDRVLSSIKPKVDKEMNDKLLTHFTSQEVEKAVSQMFPTKALGPDGFPALFYQKYWDIVGSNTISNCLDILNRGSSIRNWNTNIVLIPKTNNP